MITLSKKSFFFAVTITLSALTSAAFSQTAIDVPLTSNDRDVIAPPNCNFPCPNLDLPPFARQLALAGPDGTFKTDLTRQAFLNQLEDWRLFLEAYRQSIEKKQFDAPDWNKANIAYKVELGLYDQFFESYRNAFKMDKAGHIKYGTISQPTENASPAS